MLTVFRKIWNFSIKEQKNIKFSIFFALLNAIFNSFQFGAIYYILNKIFTNTLETRDALIVFLIMLVCVVGKIFTQKTSQLQQTHAGYFMSAHRRIEIGEKIKKVPMGFFSSFNLGKLTTLATTNLSQIEMWVPMLLVMVLGGMLTTFVFVVGLFFFNYKIALIATLGIFAFLFVTAMMERKSRKNAMKAHKIQAILTSQVLSALLGMQIIKSYNLVNENNKDLEKSFDDVRDYTLGLEKTLIPYNIIQKIVIAITTSCMLYVSFNMYVAGSIILSDLIMLTIASYVIFNGIVGAGSVMAILRVTENAIDSLNYVNEIPDMKEGSVEKEIDNFDIEFRNVEFSYNKKKILDNISCKINQNNLTAIVGPSGSGKTTFCNLIARFWDVNSGSILIGGKDIREYSLKNLMKNISFVFQNVYLFEDTIENNIKFGKPNATREEVIEVAKKSMCHDFIMSLPDGYDTIIVEGGSNLSGGEKQRISIARAMLKDAPIIIFDEATANVDPENEDKLQNAIEELTKDKTVIMIAHRLKTIRNANQILVLNQGHIEESGTHSELIVNNGLYKDLIDSKNKSVNWKIEN